jgi:hypothetical protein
MRLLCDTLLTAGVQTHGRKLRYVSRASCPEVWGLQSPVQWIQWRFSSQVWWAAAWSLYLMSRCIMHEALWTRLQHTFIVLCLRTMAKIPLTRTKKGREVSSSDPQIVQRARCENTSVKIIYRHICVCVCVETYFTDKSFEILNLNSSRY